MSKTKKGSFVEMDTRRNAFTLLKNFEAGVDVTDYIEVTEWANGDGVDVYVSRKKWEDNRRYTFTYGELSALKAILNVLDEEETDK